ncbi:hypothetical protein M8C13_21545 [Crossiella sp. SN42]|uniref:hypothetical protein n=1 Tax=Crossiella sp. SN42 TaxID=2944808 RepID=UPI00207D69D9|nr:hypothetical protein [Crossiella sp. SN42]MCO1578342.1 hypothetical protein [Crossiella sp. SN42]
MSEDQVTHRCPWLFGSEWGISLVFLANERHPGTVDIRHQDTQLIFAILGRLLLRLASDLGRTTRDMTVLDDVPVAELVTRLTSFADFRQLCAATDLGTSPELSHPVHIVRAEAEHAELTALLRHADSGRLLGRLHEQCLAVCRNVRGPQSQHWTLWNVRYLALRMERDRIASRGQTTNDSRHK